MITNQNSIPEYDATEEQRTNPKTGEITTQGIWVGRGENRKLIDPKIIWTMAEVGCSTLEMADYYQIPEQTIRYNFSEYINKSRSVMKTKLRRAQIQLALEGNAVMLIWLGKNLLGQSDNPNDSSTVEPLPWNTTQETSEHEHDA